MKRIVKTYWTILLTLAAFLCLTAASGKTDHSKDGLSAIITICIIGFGTIVTVIAIIYDKKKKAKSQSQQKPAQAFTPSQPIAKPALPEFKPYTGGGVCDVCNKSLNSSKAWIVPNNVFYSSQQYRTRLKTMRNVFGITMTDADINRMQMMDTSAGSAVCESCIHMFNGKPLPYPSANSTAPAVPTAQIRALVDKLAHYNSMVIGDNEKEKMGKELLEYGTPAVKIIDDYLISCGRGQQSYGWWNGAADLVRLLPQFPDSDCELVFKRLTALPSNIWEYQTQVKDVAEQELLKLKKAKNNYDDAAIPAENAQAELKNLYNSRATPEERIRRAIRMQPAVESWSDANKAFYYYIIGDALKRRNADDQRRLAFFAAQIYYNPVNTSLGWHELRQAFPDREIHPSPDTAKQLHEEFPLPDSFESLLAE